MYEELKKLGVTVKANASLARYTTFKIGGPARVLVLPKSVDEMVAVLKWCDAQDAQYFILGSGSNMLVSDEGYDGVVIHPEFKAVSVQDDELIAEAGALTVEVARASVSAGFTGFEWAVGIPGTIGGAVRGNAGCMGGETKDALVWVDAYRDGEVVRLTGLECAFAYRESIFKHGGGVVLRAAFHFKKGEAGDGAKKMIEHLQYRNKTQPKIASSGCMFKNVPVDAFARDVREALPPAFVEKGIVPAGWLVQEAGGKGMVVGGAEVSQVHGNFIVNVGDATAQDILTLARQVKEKVQEQFGVGLEEEIQVVGG